MTGAHVRNPPNRPRLTPAPRSGYPRGPTREKPMDSDTPVRDEQPDRVTPFPRRVPFGPWCPGVLPSDVRRAALLERLLIVLIPVTVVCGAFQWWVRPSAGLHFLLVLGAAGLGVMALVLNRMNCYREAALIVSSLPTVGSLLSLVLTPSEFIAFAYPTVGVLFAGLFLSTKTSGVLGLLNIGLLLLLPLVQPAHSYAVVAAAIGFNLFVPILVVAGSRNRRQEEEDRQKVLVESEERWRSLITYHPDPITISVNGRYRFVNSACLELFGAAALEEVVGHPPTRFAHPDSHELTKTRLEQVSAGARTEPLPFRVLGLGGEERRVEASSVPINHPDGPAAVTVLRNITEQWVAEQQLKDSEARYRAIVEHAPEAIVVVCARTGRFVECNGNADRLFGLPGEELGKTTPVSVSPAMQPSGGDSAVQWAGYMQRALAHESCDFEWWFTGVNGVVPCEVHLVRIPSGDAPLIRGSITDVSEKKAAEAALRASESQYRKLVETMNDGLVAVDQDMRITVLNDRSREIFGVDGDLTGRSLLEFVDPDQQEILIQQHALRQKGYSDPYDLRARKLDGTPIEIVVSPSVLNDAEGNYAGSLGVIRDVTKTRKLEAERRSAEAKIRTIVEHASDLITVLDRRGRIVFESPSLERMLGYRPEELLGRFVTEFVHEDDITEVNRALMRGAQSPGVPAQVEVRLRHKDGSWRIVEAVGQVLTESLDDWQVVVVSRDITERRRLESELLQISNREQRSFGQDLHDGMGQVLVGARLYAAGLAKRLEGRSAEDADGAREIGRMLDEAHDLARALARGLSPVSLEEGGLSSALYDLAKGVGRIHGVECSVSLTEPIPLHDLDAATHLYRIAQEALTNAARHAGASRIDVMLKETDQLLTLTVRDDGHGIGAGGRGNSGMGIPIMRKRASMLRGSLQVSSDTSGTEIVCEFPKQADYDDLAISPSDVSFSA